MTIDDVIRAEKQAEAAVLDILIDLQSSTGRRIEWVKVECGSAVDKRATGLNVTINTVSK